MSWLGALFVVAGLAGIGHWLVSPGTPVDHEGATYRRRMNGSWRDAAGHPVTNPVLIAALDKAWLARRSGGSDTGADTVGADQGGSSGCGGGSGSDGGGDSGGSSD